MKKVFNNLTFWVLASITAGILVGYLSPSTGVAMQPLGTYFIEVVNNTTFNQEIKTRKEEQKIKLQKYTYEE